MKWLFVSWLCGSASFLLPLAIEPTMPGPPCHGGERGDWAATLREDEATGQPYVMLLIVEEQRTVPTSTKWRVVCWVRADGQIEALPVGTQR